MAIRGCTKMSSILHYGFAWVAAMGWFLYQSAAQLARPKGGFKSDRQVAALPVRVNVHGSLEVLLITGRQSRRAIIPRGWPMRGKPDHRAAAIEAEEEAGVIGSVSAVPIGSYVYHKGSRRRSPQLTVDVYRLDVQRQLRTWREKGQRRLLWLPVDEALERVGEPGLALIIQALPATLASRPRVDLG